MQFITLLGPRWYNSPRPDGIRLDSSPQEVVLRISDPHLWDELRGGGTFQAELVGVDCEPLEEYVHGKLRAVAPLIVTGPPVLDELNYTATISIKRGWPISSSHGGQPLRLVIVQQATSAVAISDAFMVHSKQNRAGTAQGKHNAAHILWPVTAKRQTARADIAAAAAAWVPTAPVVPSAAEGVAFFESTGYSPPVSPLADQDARDASDGRPSSKSRRIARPAKPKPAKKTRPKAHRRPKAGTPAAARPPSPAVLPLGPPVGSVAPAAQASREESGIIPALSAWDAFLESVAQPGSLIDAFAPPEATRADAGVCPPRRCGPEATESLVFAPFAGIAGNSSSSEADFGMSLACLPSLLSCDDVHHGFSFDLIEQAASPGV